MKKAGDKIVVLPSNMHYEIIRKAQNGHFGAKKIMEALQEEYYIPNIS